ncbi:MAG TPA: phage/plasmid primase, P4 family [Rhizomicrobium sp.]|jgi:putative DNA primase/helicase|nr:phage/plasmid primase, P4 family [Rhizomicrobium sp.]
MSERFRVIPGERASIQEPEEIRPPEFTDEALALRFAELQRDHLRFTAKWGAWSVWDGTRWAFDETLAAFDMVRSVCREQAAACNEKRIATALASAKTVAAVEKLAKSDRLLAARTDQWDSDPLLLNTPGGVIDLRTGLVRAAKPGDYITKSTTVPLGGNCPLWCSFIERITDGDVALSDFMRRMIGYAATGITTEHALFFGHGNGSNGKSVFLNTVAAVLGDYHRTAPIETFTESASDRHPTELAGLRGARLVTAVETEEGRRWQEAKLKVLTGGDKIAARFMRQDFFEYVPQFKLIVAGNHKPGLRTVDEAIRRRFHLIPFSVTIPAEERDPELCEKLKAEWPGILRWIIDGCMEWQRDGLLPPAAVTSATAAYLEGEDAIATWMLERCQRDPDAWGKSSDLFRSWSKWADRAGEPAGTMRRFVHALEARGFAAQRKMTGRGFAGLQLLATMTGDEA